MQLVYHVWLLYIYIRIWLKYTLMSLVTLYTPNSLPIILPVFTCFLGSVRAWIESVIINNSKMTRRVYMKNIRMIEVDYS